MPGDVLSDDPAELRRRIDTTKAHPARVYDVFLGGKDHYLVDRAAAAAALEHQPRAFLTARHNRDFLRRAVGTLVEKEGVRQFLDIGAGLPTQNNVHQIAQAIAPESRVVYVDNDPIVLTHARALLTSGPEGRTDTSTRTCARWTASSNGPPGSGLRPARGPVSAGGPALRPRRRPTRWSGGSWRRCPRARGWC